MKERGRFLLIHRGFIMRKVLILIMLLVFSLQVVAFANTQAENEFQMGVKAHHGNDFFRAIDHYTNAIKLNPEMKMAYFYRGLIYANYSDKAKGIADFTTAISLDPNNADYYHERGKAYLHDRQPEKAIEDYQKTLTFTPNDADCFNGLGGAYESLKQFDQAIEFYSRSLQINANEPYVYYNRGLVYHEMEQYQEALADFEMGISKIPPKDKRKGESETYYERMYRDVVFEKAMMLDKLSRDEEAIVAYKEYISNSGFDHVRYKEFAVKRIKELNK